MTGKRSSIFPPLVAAWSLAGCAQVKNPVTPAGARVRAEAQLFSPPMNLSDPTDAVVRLVGEQMTCSGTLIAADLVLTAHHCVVERGPRGEFTTVVIKPASVRIELGGDYLAWGNVGVTHVITPPCGEQGGAADIAILVLDRKLTGLATMKPRLAGPPAVGEVVDPIGFGRCGLSPNGIHRTRRDGGDIERVTPDVFRLQASICPGDSGGPAVIRGTNEIVGIVSLSAMDADDRTRNASLMTRVDRYRPVFAQARLIADGASASELPPLACEL